MKFLLPVGGIVDRRFGILTAPNHRGIPLGIVQGMDWAADMGCIEGPDWIKMYNPLEAKRWLWGTMLPYRKTCLFIPVPDVVGDAESTLQTWHSIAQEFFDWPLAYIAQDGAENLSFPSDPEFGTVFMGGSTEWKLSEACYSVILRAQRQGKHIHIGRVNWWARYQHFRAMEGSDAWTCDGTRTRYDGTEQTIVAWAEYMERPYQIRLPLSGSHCGG